MNPLDDLDVSYTRVESSNVHSVGYKVETHTLFVRFLHRTNRSDWGTTYAYLDVPSYIYLDMLRATSKGKYLNAQVKGRYAYQQVA